MSGRHGMAGHFCFWHSFSLDIFGGGFYVVFFGQKFFFKTFYFSLYFFLISFSVFGRTGLFWFCLHTQHTHAFLSLSSFFLLSSHLSLISSSHLSLHSLSLYILSHSFSHTPYTLTIFLPFCVLHTWFYLFQAFFVCLFFFLHFSFFSLKNRQGILLCAFLCLFVSLLSLVSSHSCFCFLRVAFFGYFHVGVSGTDISVCYIIVII